MLFITWVLDFLCIEAPPIPSTIFESKDRTMTKKKLLLKSLLVAVVIAPETPPISFGRQHTLKQRLKHKTNGYGMIETERINAKTLEEVQQATNALLTDQVTQG